ncbi:hypothetical protein SNE40_016707 [Patella caerulea]|uniref:Uncharacterized protein n=1 Tax=Patella caerulea TaxID=87958 RepID=A0AAN8JCE9_PATCE
MQIDEPPDSKSSFKTLFSETTAHGCKNVISPTRSVFTRLVWLLCVLGMTCGLSANLYSLFKNYHTYPFQTVVKIEPRTKLDFPAITLCDLSYVDTTKINNSKGIFNFFLKNSFLKNLDLNESDKTYRAAQKTTVDKLFNESVTHVSEMFGLCLWKNQVIGCDNFWKPIFTDLGRCFAFNHNASDKLSVDSTGTKGALSFIASINQKGYLVSDNTAAGLKLNIHDQYQLPDVSNNGIITSPGSSTLIGLRKESYKFLPAPFKAYGDSYCVANDDPALLSKMKYSSVYNRETCIRECLGEITVNNCSCKSVTEPESLPLPYCTLEELVHCYRPTLGLYYSNNHFKVCDCPRVCVFNKYKTRISMGMFPSTNAMKELVKNNIIAGKEVGRTNFLDITIFYEDLLLEEVRHVPEYSTLSILGTVGGQMGLFLGASVITLAEFFEMFLWSVWLSVGKIHQRLQGVGPSNSNTLNVKSIKS